MKDSPKESGRQLVERYTPERCYITEWWNNVADDSVSVARVRVKPGVRTALHRLRDTRERYLILSGHGRVEVGGRPRDVHPGEVVVIEPGEAQCITNTGEKRLVFLAVCTPRFRRECYEPLDEE